MQPDSNQQPNTDAYNQTPTPGVQPVLPNQQPQVIAPINQSNIPVPTPQPVTLQPSASVSPAMGTPAQYPQVSNGTFSSSQTTQAQSPRRNGLKIVGIIVVMVILGIGGVLEISQKNKSVSNEVSNTIASSSSSTYTDPVYGFTLQLPAGWQKNTQNSTESKSNGNLFFGNPSAPTGTGLFVDWQEVPSDNSVPLSKVASDGEATNSTSTVLSSQKETVDGDAAIEDFMQTTVNGKVLDYNDLYLQASPTLVYSLNGAWPKNSSYESAVKGIVSSFKP